MHRARLSILVVLLGLPATAAGGPPARATHEVAQGESLWTISRSYGCPVDLLRQVNDLDSTLIRPGQRLAIPSCASGSDAGDRRVAAATAERGDADRAPRRSAAKAATGPLPGALLDYVVVSGDTLGTIARRFDTSVDDLRTRNRLTSTRIRTGQTLRVLPGSDGSGRPIPGQSVGAPHDGRLVNGTQLPDGPGYVRRRPHRAWGANHVVHQVRRAVAQVRSRHKGLHDLAIGDLSAQAGGPIAEHRSHRSGRDVDIGLYFKAQPKGYPASFVVGTGANLHFAATWHLIEAFARTADQPGGVERIFISYELQKLMYDWAVRNGVSRAFLDRTFQYPRGETTPHGIIRHEPGHDGHLHVRFKCPPADHTCH